MSHLDKKYVPVIVVYPWHERVRGVAPLYHATCEDHPNFTPCDKGTSILEIVENHLIEDHPETKF